METNEPSLSRGGRLMLAALLAAILAMFAGSFLYRMQGLGLNVRIREVDSMSDPMRSMMGVDVKALKAQIKTAQAHPENAGAQLALAKNFMKMQAWDEALGYLKIARRDAPGDLDVLRALGVVRFQRKEYGLAHDAFALVLKKDPDDATAHYNMGILLKHFLRRPAEAEKHFRRVLAIGSDDPEVVKGAKAELTPPGGR